MKADELLNEGTVSLENDLGHLDELLARVHTFLSSALRKGSNDKIKKCLHSLEANQKTLKSLKSTVKQSWGDDA